MPEKDLPAQIARTLVTAYGSPQDEADAVIVIRTVAARSLACGVRPAVVERRLDYWYQRLPGVLGPLATLEDALDDLAAELRRPAPRTAAQLMAAFAQHWNIVLACAGALAAVAVYTANLGYQRYYDALGLDSQDLGVSPAGVLARSALGTGLLIVIGTIVVFALLAPACAVVMPVSERHTLPGGSAKAFAVPRTDTEQAVKFALLTVGSVIAIASSAGPILAGVGGFAACLAAGIAVPSVRARLVATVSACLLAMLLLASTWIGAAAWVTVAVVTVGVSHAAYILRARRTRLPHVAVAAFRVDLVTLVPLAFAAALLCVVGVIYTLPRMGADAGERAREGRRVDSTTIAGVPVLDVHARPAKVLWKHAGSPVGRPDVRGCLLYLGRDGDAALVYHVRRARPVTAQNRSEPPAIVSRSLLRIEPEDAFVTIGGNDQCLPADE